MKTRFIMKPCYCDRLVKAIDNYIQKADNDLSDLLGKEGYVLYRHRQCHQGRAERLHPR